MDEKNEISYVNEQMAEMMGYTVDESLGSLVFNFISNKDSLKVQNELKMRDKGIKRHLELPLCKKDGSFIWTLISGNTLFDYKDSFIGTLCMIKDISERKKFEMALAESEEKFRSIVEQSRDGIAIVNENGIVTEWNYGMDEITGYTREKVLGNYIWDIQYQLNPEERISYKLHNWLKTNDMDVIEKGNFKQHNESFEVEIQHAKGSKRAVKIRYFPIKTNREKMVASVVHDITEQKKIEENLKRVKDNLEEKVQERTENLQISNETLIQEIIEREKIEEKLIESEAQLKIAMDLARLVHWEYDVSSDLFTFDDQFYKLYGTTAKEEGGTKMFSEEYARKFVPPEESSCVAEEITKSLETNDPNFSGQREHTIIRADGEKRSIIVRHRIIKDEKGRTIKTYGTNQDITEHKKAEEKMKRLIKELKRSNDELQRFAYITSHDLQEPLRTIASFTQLLERRYKNKLDSDADEFMDYIVEASVRMKQMINDLLEYSQVVRVERKCTPLKSEDILLDVLNSLNLMIKENNAEITYDSLPTIIADENQIARVFQNLIENAIKFKKENNPIRIHISAHRDDENNEYIFSVSDNGIGIEKQYFDRIFTIFQRLHTREDYNGNGIGLSISKRIIERHSGRMRVESEPGVGSTFYF